jgi:cytoskeletal protein RodZ
MNRVVVPRRRIPLVLVGTLLSVAAVAWGTEARNPATPSATPAIQKSSKSTTTKVSSTKQTTKKKSAAAQTTKRTTKSTVSAEAGMRIYRDPETGQIGPPTAEGIAAASTDPSTSEEMTGLRQVMLPDGSVMIDLQGRFQESMVVQLDSKGQRVMSCTRDPQALMKHAPVAKTPQREER